MTSIAFWLGPANRVFVQLDEDRGVPDCYATRLVVQSSLRISGPPCLLRLRSPGRRRIEVSGHRLEIDHVPSLDGTSSSPGTVFATLAEESRRQAFRSGPR